MSGNPRNLADLPQGKNPRHQSNKSLGDSHGRSGHFEERSGLSSLRELNFFCVVRHLLYACTNWATQVIINWLYY